MAWTPNAPEAPTRPPVTGWWALNVSSIVNRLQQLSVSMSGEISNRAQVVITAKKVSAALSAVMLPSGTVLAATKPVAASFTGLQAQFATIASTMPAATTTAMVGALIQQGHLDAVLLPLAASMVGNQQQSGTIAPAITKTRAAFIGQQQQSGLIVSSLPKLATAMSAQTIQQGGMSSLIRPLSAAALATETYEAAMAASIQKASDALSGVMLPEGMMSASMQKASSILVGGQTQTATITAALQAVRAAAAASQSQSGAAVALLKKAAAALAGSQTQSGALAITLQQAAIAIAGTYSSSIPKPVVRNATPSSTTTCTIGTHSVNNLIIAVAYRLNATQAFSAPAAGGTVPTWTAIENNAGANANNLNVFQAKATATNHTSGTWTGAGEMMMIVISGQKATSPIGDHATQNAIDQNNVVCPAITLTHNDGSSLLLYIGAHRNSVSAIDAAPSGFTRVAATSDLQLFLNTKDDTSSDGGMTQPITGSSNNSYFGATVEVVPY